MPKILNPEYCPALEKACDNDGYVFSYAFYEFLNIYFEFKSIIKYYENLEEYFGKPFNDLVSVNVYDTLRINVEARYALFAGYIYFKDEDDLILFKMKFL